MRVRFGDFVLDGDARQLARNGEPLSLSPKAFQLLQTLLEHAPRALSKKELMDALWPDVFVEEENLKARIAEIRAALGDRGRERRYVRTVHRFGYAFSAPTEEERPEGRGRRNVARLVHDLQAFVLGDGANVVGRDADCEVLIDASGVSRRHAEIHISPEGITVQDLRSKNGTWVNGRRISSALEIRDGDRIQVGAVILTLRASGEAGNTDTLGR